MLLAALALLLAAQEELLPAVVDDLEAQSTHAYLRRKSACTAEAKAALPALTASRMIHQIWWQGEAEIPRHFEPLRASWRVHHPHWGIRLWDEAAIVRLINETYGWFASTFHALPSNIQKADAARYVILHSEGGLYADLDIEAFRPFDDVVEAKDSRGSVIFFEEPVTHWDAHGTVISNGLIASPKGHPLMSDIIKSVLPMAEVFTSGGSYMLQTALQSCNTNGRDSNESCSCYVTKSSEHFFPLHDGMRRPEEFVSTKSHASALRKFVEDMKSNAWPTANAFSAQYWTVSWIDPDVGRLFLEAIAAARGGDVPKAEKLFYTTLWSKWGTKYKYRETGNQTKKARDAYERSIDLDPTYSWGYFELALIELEAARPEKALFLLKTALKLRPSVVLFHNNAGVAQLALGQNKLAEASFRNAIELEASSFATIKGLSPRAGAHVNLGMALSAQGRKEEANEAYRAALNDASSYQYSLQAAQRLKEAGADLGPQDELSVLLGDALLKEGRTREAAIRYASAHQHAETPGIRHRVAERMDTLSEVWDLGPQAKRLSPGSTTTTGNGKGGKPSGGAAPKVKVHQAGPDGKTTEIDLGSLSPELLAQLRSQGLA